MATIDAHRDNDQHGAERVGPAGVTVHEVHHQVCTARLLRCPPGRAHTARHGRRRHHLPVSHYRATGHFGVIADSPDTLPQNDTQRRHAALTVLALTVAMGVLYLGAVRVLEPGSNGRVLLLGAFLVTTGGAVVLNAITVQATNRPAGNSGR